MDWSKEYSYRKAIVDTGRKVVNKGWGEVHAGNISVKISDDVILCTPHDMNIADDSLLYSIVKVDKDGRILEGNLEPTSELKLHLDIYKNRKDVKSVLHAHPPYATAFATAGLSLDRPVLPELIIPIGAIPLAKYATPSSDEFSNSIINFLKDYNVFLLGNHGALSIGDNVENAYEQMSGLEECAKIIFFAKLLGKVNILSKDNVNDLMDLRKKFGIKNKNNQFNFKKINESDL